MTHTSPVADLVAGSSADASTLRALEFDAIVEQLAGRTSFDPSRELALATVPVADAAHVGLLQDQTDEADQLLADQAQTSIGGARDIRAALERAGRGGRLTPAELLEVGETLDATDRFATRLKAWRGPHLSEVRELLDPAPELAARIARSVDESGEILDTASAELAATRKRLRTAQERVRERLNAMLRSSAMAGIIGEAIVTLRAGRYVIPIRAEAKGRVKGIVHDQSASGATLFVEPLTVVELNNKWTEASLAAAREEERILDELSGMVEGRVAPLRDSLSGLARADLWLARARLGTEMDGVRPTVAEDAAELLSARHPLLGDSAVPIDVRLGDRFGYRALVVTGPNTGGKTVSLKTLGLLSLMHQAGLRVPAADGARLPVFRRVMADIGDEQSIAQSLSTFSSHLRNVVRFVADAGPATLVLLDEVGAGTDPAEGSALAMAIVSRLLDAGAMVAATTHYAELKAFATEHPGVTNAAVEFDVSTLRPTYRLTIGLPGQEPGLRDRRSARPSGADPRRCARADLGGARIDGGNACRDCRGRAGPGGGAGSGERRSRLGRRRARARPKRGRAGTSRGRQAPGRCPPLRRRARRACRARGGRPSPRDDPPAKSHRRATWRERTGRGGPQPSGRPCAIGDGRRESRGRRGFAGVGSAASRRPLWTVTNAGQHRTDRRDQRADRPGHARDRGGRLVVPADDVEVVPEPISGPTPRDVEAEELRRRAAQRVAPRLDLHGERVEAALERLNAYLDDALLAGLDEVVIVHGIGTGALRRAVREALAEHPRVRAIRGGRKDEGGDGATVAEL